MQVGIEIFKKKTRDCRIYCYEHLISVISLDLVTFVGLGQCFSPIFAFYADLRFVLGSAKKKCNFISKSIINKVAIVGGEPELFKTSSGC